MLLNWLDTVTWKTLGRTHRLWGGRLQHCLNNSWLVLGFDRENKKGRHGKQTKGESSSPHHKWGQATVKAGNQCAHCMLFTHPCMQMREPSDFSTQPLSGQQHGACLSLLQHGHWNEPIQTWRRQQTCNNLFVATVPIPSPISIHTPPYCSPDNDRHDRNCRGVLQSGREADKEYLSLLSAQMCKSLFTVLWGTEQNSCFH